MTRLLVDPATDFDDPAAVTLSATLLDPGPALVRTFEGVTAGTVVDLPAPDATSAWRLTARRAGRIVTERTVHWTGTDPLAWAALTDVDPATLKQPAGSPLLDVSLDDLRTTLLGGASTAYDTLKELEDALKGDDTALGGILTTLGTKLDQAAVDARISTRADPAGAAAAVTLAGLGGITPAGVAAGYAPKKPAQLSPLVGAFGDSLSVNTDTATKRTDSPLFYASLKSLGQIQYAYQGGIGGQTSAQIAARVADAVASNAQTIVVLVGANDATGTGPFATTTRPNLDAIVAALLAGGKTPVLATLPPRGTAAAPPSTAQRTFVAEYNLYVRRLAAQLGTPVVDYFSALADIAGGYYSATTQNDGIHPNLAGWSSMGSALSAALAPLLPPANVPLPVVNNDPASITDNALFLNVTGLLPTGWAVSAGTSGLDGYTITTVAATLGNKIRLDFTGTTAQKSVWRQGIPVTAGNRLLFACRMAWSGVAPNLQVDTTSGGVTTFGAFRPVNNTPASQTAATPILYEWTVPAGVTGINVELVVSSPATGWLEASQFAIYDLTAHAQL